MLSASEVSGRELALSLICWSRARPNKILRVAQNDLIVAGSTVICESRKVGHPALWLFLDKRAIEVDLMFSRA